MASGKIEQPVSEYCTFESDDLVDIIGYNSSSNPYTAPCDGYAWVRNASNKGGTIQFSPSAGALTMSIGGVTTTLRSCCFVKKGIRMFVSGTVDAAYFFPLLRNY